jgi:hypothetical protein
MEGDILGIDLQPGDICARTGLYEVIHEAHRSPHRVVVSVDDIFPPCRQCGLNVRFRLLMHNTDDPLRIHVRAARKRGG